MPGAFWGPPRPNNSSSRPFRRRRSLLGRKIHSENDLPEQDPSSLNQQQQQQLQPHTALVLPENVKTILIAGTPECWNLTTSPTPYSPTTAASSITSMSHTCDASLATMGSEFSPGATTIDEEEPYEGGLNWMLPTNTASSSSKNQPSRKTPKQETTATRIQPEPSSMVVMYSNSCPLPPPQQALHVWCKFHLAVVY